MPGTRNATVQMTNYQFPTTTNMTTNIKNLQDELIKAKNLRIEVLLEIIENQKELIVVLRDIIDIKSGRKN